jgi:hypothetical protein
VRKKREESALKNMGGTQTCVASKSEKSFLRNLNATLSKSENDLKNNEQKSFLVPVHSFRSLKKTPYK